MVDCGTRCGGLVESAELESGHAHPRTRLVSMQRNEQRNCVTYSSYRVRYWARRASTIRYELLPAVS
jgi:hypothetical protein